LLANCAEIVYYIAVMGSEHESAGSEKDITDPDGHGLTLTPAEEDRLAVEGETWMLAHFPALYENVRPEELQPDKYPEHQVLTDFLRNRQWVRGLVQKFLASHPIK